MRRNLLLAIGDLLPLLPQQLPLSVQPLVLDSDVELENSVMKDRHREVAHHILREGVC